MFPVYRAMGERLRPDLKVVGDAIQDMALSHGITTVQDGATSADWAASFAYMAQQGRLKLDVVAYPLYGNDMDGILRRQSDYVGPDYHGRFRIGGVKVIVDGSPQARTAWVSQPYTEGSEGPGFKGQPSLSAEDFHHVARLAIDNGWQLLTHTNGDAASEFVLDGYRQALEESSNSGKYTLRPVMIHCQLARTDQYERMAALNMVPSIFASHCWYWGDVHLRNFGAERGQRISATADAKRLGLPFTLHTDSPVIEPNLFEAVWCAATRRTRAGVQLDVGQRITVADGLRAITANAARQYGEEACKGTLDVGKLADLTIVDRDPLTVPLNDTGAPDESLRNVAVVETFKEGHSVWHR